MVLLKKNLGSVMDSEDIIEKDLATVMSARSITEIESALETVWRCS